MEQSYKLITSNRNKAEEFSAFFPDLEVIRGEDIKEVYGTLDDVIIYKSLDAGKNLLVEDTVLVINEQVKVDIKWNVDSIKEGDKLEWITSIGYNDGNKIFVSRASIKGRATKSKGTEGFAFDPYFIPEELINPSDDDLNYDLVGLTLAQLAKVNLKKFFSARIKALSNFKKQNFISITNIDSISPWTGTYQNEKGEK